jgi:osmoprotectant transport system ATP-binding protein
MQKYNSTVVLVTHDLKEARQLTRNFAVLEGGRVVQQGDIEVLQSAPASNFIARP